MDRDELIARLRREANAMENGLNKRLRLFVRCREADTMREAAEALESRPAPTEERAREVLAEELEVRGLTEAARGVSNGSVEITVLAYLAAVQRFASDTTPSRPDLEALKDPNAVHVNMLRGGIARPSHAQIWHIFGAGLEQDMPDDVRATLAPSRDEEGSVDREAVLAALNKLPEPEYWDGTWEQAISHAQCVVLDYPALKTSTPETQTVEGGGQ